MTVEEYLKKFDSPNNPQTRFYSCDYMVAFAEYYHKEKLKEPKQTGI